MGFTGGIWGGERWNGELGAEEVSLLVVDLKNVEVEILREVRTKE